MTDSPTCLIALSAEMPVMCEATDVKSTCHLLLDHCVVDLWTVATCQLLVPCAVVASVLLLRLWRQVVIMLDWQLYHASSECAVRRGLCYDALSATATC